VGALRRLVDTAGELGLSGVDLLEVFLPLGLQTASHQSILGSDEVRPL